MAPHCRESLYGAFVWARRALNSRKRRFPARAVGVLRLLLARGVELDAVDPRNGTTVIPQLVGRTLTLERRGVLYRDQLLQAVKVKLRGQPSVQMPLTGQGGNGQAGKWTQRTIFT